MYLDSRNPFHIDLDVALKQQFECKDLPPIELKRFNGNPMDWPDFTECFH